MFGNGLSTSPSYAAPEVRGAAFPEISVADNVIAQHRLLINLGGRHIRMIAGAARCSPHNFVFLEGVKAALKADPAYADGRYTSQPIRGLHAFGTAYAGWAYSQEFFRTGTYRDLGYENVGRLLSAWASDHEQMDANNLLAMLHTWQQADVGTAVRGGFEGALRHIQARCIVMPSTTDLYFPTADSRIEVDLMSDAKFRSIVSDLGHIAGRPGIQSSETDQISDAMRQLLSVL